MRYVLELYNKDGLYSREHYDKKPKLKIKDETVTVPKNNDKHDLAFKNFGPSVRDLEITYLGIKRIELFKFDPNS